MGNKKNYIYTLDENAVNQILEPDIYEAVVDDIHHIKKDDNQYIITYLKVVIDNAEYLVSRSLSLRYKTKLYEFLNAIDCTLDEEGGFDPNDCIGKHLVIETENYTRNGKTYNNATNFYNLDEFEEIEEIEDDDENSDEYDD